MENKTTIDQLKLISQRVGLSYMGHMEAAPLQTDGRRLSKWQNDGRAGEMAYMERDPRLFCDPRALLPSAKSVLLFCAHYSRFPRSKLTSGFGRVARYAWGRDYHRALKKRLKHFVSEYENEAAGGIEARVFTDAVPFLERAFARGSGLGFIGKNSMLITPKWGSFSLIGEIVWNVRIQSDPLPLVEENCGSCQRCRTDCPTGAIVEDYVIDARKCISYLTIEKRGSFDIWEREALGEWVFGCDVCQEVCPFNHAPLKRELAPDLPDFLPERGVGESLQLGTVLEVRSKSSFASLYSGTPLMRAGREGLLRNAACVAWNTRSEELLPVLEKSAREDLSPVVRQHSLWAFVRMTELTQGVSKGRLKSQLSHALKDPDERVRTEAAALDLGQ